AGFRTFRRTGTTGNPWNSDQDRQDGPAARGLYAMNLTQPVFGLNLDPIDAILARGGDAVLAVITGVEGPSYRPVGATMAVFPDRHRVGTLSSGYIENDIALHALDALEKGRP